MWHAFLKKNEITITPLSEVVAKLRTILEPALVQAAIVPYPIPDRQDHR
jgi:hypothetical protein